MTRIKVIRLIVFTMESERRRKAGPLSKERLDAAHQVYLDMVSDPEINFNKQKKENILNQFRNKSQKSSDETKSISSNSSQQKHVVYNKEERKKERAPLIDPRIPPPNSPRDKKPMSRATAQFYSKYKKQDNATDDYIRQRKRDEELSARRLSNDEALRKKFKRQAIQKYRCDKERQNLTKDLQKIKDFEIALHLEEMRKPVKHYAMPDMYLHELRHQEKCEESSKFLTSVVPPKPRKHVPQPLPLNDTPYNI